jgi:TIR domain
MKKIRDLFISYASADKEQYILPLSHALTTHSVSFWLDVNEIDWGSNFVLKINDGLRNTRYALLCLSKNFLARAWPESEMSAVLSIQNTKGEPRLLPLILNSKEDVLNFYPILAPLAYRELNSGVDVIAAELATLVHRKTKAQDTVQVTIESAHTGQSRNLIVSRRVSVKWLVSKAQSGLNTRDKLEAGEFAYFYIRWVLVDVRATKEWKKLARSKKRKVYAVVKTEKGVNFAYAETDRLEQIGVYDGIIFHLFPIEDVSYPLSVAEGPIVPPPGGYDDGGIG